MTHPNPSLPSPLAWLGGRDPIPTVAWHDPAVTTGFEPDSEYVEKFWLPRLGPSTTWALRRIVSLLSDAADSGLWLPVEPLGRSLGLGASTTRKSPVLRAIARLVDFRLASIDPDRDVLAVRTIVPALTRRGVAQLPGHLRIQHETDYGTCGQTEVEDATRSRRSA